ncbi:MAG: 4-hydroxy-tetrahydrodipicolinate reductase [Crocinitomicaceae bacterium]|nr:4-hydroxy-tetrahydrodipicolinate reductase [Crocinitomicaceae bacterium]
MKIALFGYGKMGKEIEKIALERGHSITGKINRSNPKENLDLNSVDVVIEFSAPELALEHIQFCLNNNLPVIIGTTGNWYNHLDDLKKICLERKGAMLHATNFSLGVNLFFAVNKYLANLMNAYPDYSASITEIHHTQKLDSPSGTGISIAEQIISNHTAYTKWENVTKENIKDSTSLSIESLRLPDVPGTHEVKYESSIDTIEIKHTAHNRKGFALGSVIAAEWLIKNKGVFTMNDVLNL